MSYVLTPLKDAIIEHGALTVLTDFTGETREEGNASLRLIQMLEAAYREAPVEKTLAVLFASADSNVLAICHDTVESQLSLNRKLTMLRLTQPDNWVGVAAELVNYLRDSAEGRKFDAIYVDGGSLSFTEITDWAGLARELRELASTHEAYAVLSRWRIKLPDPEPEPVSEPEVVTP